MQMRSGTKEWAGKNHSIMAGYDNDCLWRPFMFKISFISNISYIPLFEMPIGHYGLDMLNIIREELDEPEIKIEHINEICPYDDNRYSMKISEEQAIESKRFNGTNVITVSKDTYSLNKYFDIKLRLYYTIKYKNKYNFFNPTIYTKTLLVDNLQTELKNIKLIEKKVESVKVNWFLDEEWLYHDWKNANFPVN